MNENLELATDKLSEWQSRLGVILSKPERKLINDFVSRAHGGENGSDVVWMTKRELRARLPRDDVIRITIHHDENS